MSLSRHGLGLKMARGAAWMVLMRIGERGLGLLSTLLLARLLVPADFGLVAMATSILGVLEVMGSFGFDLALIQNQRAERRHFDTAWTLTVVYGLVSGVLVVILAVPASHFFGDPRLQAILYLFAVAALVQGFENIGIVAFQKELDFRRDFNFRMLKKIVGFLVTITLA